MFPNNFPYQMPFQFFLPNVNQVGQASFQGFNNPFVNNFNYDFQQNFMGSCFNNTSHYRQSNGPEIQVNDICSENTV